MGVTVDIGDVGKWRENLVNLAPVPHPEVPRRVVFVQRIMAEDHDRLILWPGGKGRGKPCELIAADTGPGAGHTPIQGRHMAHPLFGSHLLGRPVVRTATEPESPVK